MTTKAVVKTSRASLLLKKLCRHFAHKVPTTMNERQGIIDFPFGRCLLAASDESLDLSIELRTAQEAMNAEQVLGGHLLRMAPGEELALTWTRKTRADVSKSLNFPIDNVRLTS